MWCMEHEEEFAGMNVDDKSDDESFTSQEMPPDSIDDELLTPIAHKDLHLETTKESLNKELFNRMRKIEG